MEPNATTLKMKSLHCNLLEPLLRKHYQTTLETAGYDTKMTKIIKLSTNPSEAYTSPQTGCLQRLHKNMGICSQSSPD